MFRRSVHRISLHKICQVSGVLRLMVCNRVDSFQTSITIGLPFISFSLFLSPSPSIASTATPFTSDKSTIPQLPKSFLLTLNLVGRWNESLLCVISLRESQKVSLLAGLFFYGGGYGESVAHVPSYVVILFSFLGFAYLEFQVSDV